MSEHTDRHDPIADHARCPTCNAALRVSFTALADMDLGPKDADTLIEVLRAEAAKVTARGTAA